MKIFQKKREEKLHFRYQHDQIDKIYCQGFSEVKMISIEFNIVHHVCGKKSAPFRSLKKKNTKKKNYQENRLKLHLKNWSFNISTEINAIDVLR